MKMMRGDKLSPMDQHAVLSAYCYRMTRESISRWPEASQYMMTAGFALPIISDRQWLACTEFCVTNSGRLSRRHSNCVTYRGQNPGVEVEK